ncbi:MAG: hypothetical protein ABI999_15340 [Acidobacteriota bacterium]
MQNLEFRTGVIKPIECVKEAWERIKPDFWILFAVFLVGAILGAISFYVVMGAMICGINYVFLKQIDGKTIAFDDLWKGMPFLWPGLVITLFIVVPMVVVYGIIYVPVLAATLMGERMSQNELLSVLGGAFAVDLVLIAVMVCFHTLLMFSFPLLVDKNLGAIKAMTTSARAVWKNMGGVVGLIFLNMGIALLGGLAFCIGIYLAIPVIFATNIVAYRKVFPAYK